MATIQVKFCVISLSAPLDLSKRPDVGLPGLVGSAESHRVSGPSELSVVPGNSAMAASYP